MLKSYLLAAFLIVFPFAIPFIVIGLVKLSDMKKLSQSSPPDIEKKAHGSASDKNISPQSGLTVSTVLFLIGTAFVVLSGLAFGAANWVNTTDLGRVAIIAAAAVVSFILSAVIANFLKLSGTSISFFILGTGFTVTAMITASYYKLLGEWLSFSGNGTFGALALSALFTTALLFLGYNIFKKSILAYTGFTTADAFIYFTIFLICQSFSSRATALTVLSAVILAALYEKKLLKDSRYETAIKIIGIISVFINCAISLTYVFSCLRAPTVSAYIIVLTMIAQLIFYGKMYKLNVLISVSSIIEILLAYVITMSVYETLDRRYSILTFSLISLLIYCSHRFILFFRNIASEFITLGILLIGALLCIFNEESSAFVPEMMIGIATAVLITSYIFSKPKAAQITAGCIAPIFTLVLTIYSVDAIEKLFNIEDFSGIICLIVCTIVIIAASAFIKLLPKFASSFCTKHPYRSDIIHYANLILSGFTLMALSCMHDYYITVLILCIMHFALSSRMKCNFTAVLSSLNIIFTTYHASLSSYKNTSIQAILALFATIIVYAALSRILCRKGFIYKNNGKYVIDPMLSSIWLAIFILCQPNKTNIFFVLLAGAVYIASFIKKNTSKLTASVLLTISTALAIIALMARPCLVPSSQIVSNKINISLIVLAGIACRFIWREYKTAAKTSSDTLFVVSASALLIDAFYFYSVTNTIYIMAVMLIVLIISIITRSKTWFITAAVSLTSITLYATRKYLMALSWWIYLFFAGILLIALAAVNEYCKKNNETIKTSVAKKFSGWTW